MTFHKFLDRAFSPPLPNPPINCFGWCAMCGEEFIEAYPLNLKSATAEVSDLFRYPSEWLCPPCARLYANSVLKGNLLALPDKGIRPFVATASATEERPIPVGYLKQFPLDVQHTAWTPPYWLGACMTMCVPIGGSHVQSIQAKTEADGDD